MSTVHTLRLDARQRAMLDEMGVKVWWPNAPEPEAVPEPEAAVVEDRADPAPMPPDDGPPFDMDAPPPPMERGYDERERPAEPPRAALSPAARPAPARTPAPTPAPAPRPTAPAPLLHGGAAVLVDAPLRLYAGAEEGALGVQGGWLVVADMPPEADGRHGAPFSGDAGKLLDNMLRALRLHDGGVPVHLMRTHRGVAAGQPGSPRPIDEAFGELAAGVAPVRVLAMGPLAAQSLMQSTDPLGRLRGRVVPLGTLGGVPVVATYHPAYLLRNPGDKARAWADLCLAADQG